MWPILFHFCIQGATAFPLKIDSPTTPDFADWRTLASESVAGEFFGRL
jgi:hypothetical protein